MIGLKVHQEQTLANYRLNNNIFSTYSLIYFNVEGFFLIFFYKDSLSVLTLCAPCPSGLLGGPGCHSMLAEMHTLRFRLVMWFSWALLWKACIRASRWRSKTTFSLGRREIILKIFLHFKENSSFFSCFFLSGSFPHLFTSCTCSSSSSSSSSASSHSSYSSQHSRLPGMLRRKSWVHKFQILFVYQWGDSFHSNENSDMLQVLLSSNPLR